MFINLKLHYTFKKKIFLCKQHNALNVIRLQNSILFLFFLAELLKQKDYITFDYQLDYRL